MINPKNQTIFERYSNAVILTQSISKVKIDEKALVSAELLISKLKKENDNLIEANRYLENLLDQDAVKYNNLIKDFESESEKYRIQL